MDMAAVLVGAITGVVVGAGTFLVLQRRGRRGRPAPPELPTVAGEAESDQRATKELIAAWVQFLRSEAADTANALNNRLNAIARLKAGIDETPLGRRDQKRMEQIGTEIRRASGLAAGLLHRVDPIAPDAVPPPYLTLRDAPHRPANLLIVEDDQRNREVITNLLRELGHRVTPARDGIEGFAHLEAGNFDCVLCDIRMAGLGGRSLFEQVESKMPNMASRFVFVTGDYNRPETRAFLAQTGCPVVTKPYEVAELLSAITATLQRVGVIVDAPHNAESADSME